MKLSHLTIAISVALGLAACGGSSNNVDNSTTTTGGGSGGAGGTGGSGGTTTTTPPEPEDGPDVVKEALREAPDMTPEARFVQDIKARKAIYSGRNDRQTIAGYQDFDTSKLLANNDAYQEFPGNVPALIETHYIGGTTKVADTLRSGAIYNYVDKGHVVGTGLLASGEGIASSNPGAVIADPGFTYAQGADGRYYRMQPVGVNWNQVSPNTRYAPLNTNNAGQFTGGTVGQNALVFIPNARAVSSTFVSNYNGFAQSITAPGITNAYDYQATGLPSIDSQGVAGGVDGITLGGNNDTFVWLGNRFNVPAGNVGTLNLITSTAGTTALTATAINVDVDLVPLNAGTHRVRRPGTASTNTYFAVATATDASNGQVVAVLPAISTTTTTTPPPSITTGEVAGMIALGQSTATSTPTGYISRVQTVTATNANPVSTFTPAGQLVQLSPGQSIREFYDAAGNLVFLQAANAAGNSIERVIPVTGTNNSNAVVAGPVVTYSQFPAALAADQTSTAALSDGTPATQPVTATRLAFLVNAATPITSGNGFDVNRGVVEWNYMTMLGKQYDLASNVTSKANELDFSSLEVGKKIQDVPLTVTYTIKGDKGSQSTGDDKDEVQTVEAGMLKVYNLPYHRSFVNINQDAVDNNPANRGFYDSFDLAANGIGNGRYGALQVSGVETQGIPWNGRAKYTGSSYGIYTDGQYVSGDIQLEAEFAKDRAQVLGTVFNRKLADGGSAPDMSLERIALVGSTATRNYDTGTAAMSVQNLTPSGDVTIGGVQNAGIWEFQLYGPNAEEIGGLIQYGRNAPITGQIQPGPIPAATGGAAGARAGGYNEVFSAQRGLISNTSNQSQIPVK